jgi:hypothetical protein
MSTTNKNKKKTVSEALLEMDKVSKAIKEESKSTLSSLLSEAVKDYLKEEIGTEDEEEKDEDDYSIEDDSTEIESDDETSTETEDDDEFGVDDEDEDMEDSEESDDEWSELDEYKVDDETYDLTTGEKGDETLVKVYKLLKDEDQVVVKKDGDSLSLKDGETGAEYVIELGCDDECEVEDVDYEFEMANGDDDEEDYNNDEEENVMEGRNMVFEIDLGYTDNYQDKDPIQGLSNDEPSKSGKSWHKGVPTGTKKPWAGKGSSAPFNKKTSCNEEELLTDIAADDLTGENTNVPSTPLPEATNVTLSNRRKMTKSHSMQQKDYPQNAHHDSKNGEYKALEEMVKKLQKENKEMKAMIPQIKKAMNESVIVNVKLGRIVKLLSENATTKKEKVDIINRFEEAKSISETKALYESIKRELNSSSKKTPMFENTGVKAEKPQVVETTVYQSNDLKEMLDFMKRMENC